MTEKRKWKVMTKSASINDYKQDVSRALRDPNFQKLPKHNNNGDDPDSICAELEKLDQELTNRIQNAYDNINTTARHWWTLDIHRTIFLVRYWSAQ
eukprot:14824163-Ditylum_brightwellii.AAC.1